MKFLVNGSEKDLPVKSVTIAGYTSRDRAHVQAHIDELAEMGIPGPSNIPVVYKVGKEMFTQDALAHCLGPDSSGEVEPILTISNGRLLMGLCSDHTDRELEKSSIAHSKQICPKPVSRELWDLSSIENRDALILRCEIEENGAWVVYQEGTLGGIMPLEELWELTDGGEGDWLLCGTFPAIGGIRPAGKYRMSMTDPATGRKLILNYGVLEMPVLS